jgi:hypothetical protein
MVDLLNIILSSLQLNICLCIAAVHQGINQFLVKSFCLSIFARILAIVCRVRVYSCMEFIKSFNLLFILFISLGFTKTPIEKQQKAEEVLAGFESRVESLFRLESKKPLKRAKKNPPLKPGRGNYTRGYSYSIAGFAARCFYLGEMLDEANAALVENAQHYLDNPKDIHDRDSFHWHAEIILRFIEEYGSNGVKKKGFLTKKTEEIILEPIWLYVKKVSTRQKAEFKKSQTWHIYESENHHGMIFTTCWHFSKLAKDHPKYKKLKYDDGAIAQVHFQAWNEYFFVYCLERARKGGFVEMMSDGYNSTLMKGIYNFYDFGNAKVKRAAGNLLDLYFSYWAQEQINGVQGGGRSRIYFYNGMKQNRHSGSAALAYFYFGIGKISRVSGHDVGAAFSSYRPPAVVVDIALDHSGRGHYEVRQRPRGLATEVGMHPYKMNVKKGGIIRYSYCDPSFILGTTMVESRPDKDWAKISSQNRWQGVIFADDNDARIIPIVRPRDNRVALNAQWSVQKKGCLITQKLRGQKGGAEMIVWISKAGLSIKPQEAGIIFIEAKEAYASIRIVKGGYKLTEDLDKGIGGDGSSQKSPPAYSMILKDQFSPIILEVIAKSDVKSFNEFKAKTKACSLKVHKNFVEYKSIYGDTLKIFTDYSQVPFINGKALSFETGAAFSSPFLNSEWNSGKVKIQKGKMFKILDFNSQSK